MKRSKELEKTVETLLNWNKFSFVRISNYICYKCHAVQNSKASGFPDFFIYHPFILAIEVKTGRGRVQNNQEIVRQKMIESGIEYLIVRDNVDELLEYIEKIKTTIKIRNKIL